MRLHEFVNLHEDGGTVSGAIATVAQPLGGTISRSGGSFFSGTKYSNDTTPNTPDWMKQYKQGKTNRAR